jgi:hypothetical protein
MGLDGLAQEEIYRKHQETTASADLSDFSFSISHFRASPFPHQGHPTTPPCQVIQVIDSSIKPIDS